MKRVHNVRYLATKEQFIATSVFKMTLPYNKIVISDGLGGGDRPFTVPTSLPLGPSFNVKVAGVKYVIHAGDGYYGMSTLPEDKNTLIHELTHVWQGEHGDHYILGSLWAQAIHGNRAYQYDIRNLKAWDDYNAEQQAQIVEDWYAAGMQETDPRFNYIEKNVRGEGGLPGDFPLPPRDTRYA